MIQYGFLRVAAAVPALRVADCAFNAEHVLGLMARAEGDGVGVLVFPELALTGYTCADLFQQLPLQRGAIAGLLRLAEEWVRSEALGAIRFTVDGREYVLEAGEVDWELDIPAAAA